MAIDFEGCHGRVPLVNLKSTWLCEVFIRGENWKDDIWVAGGRWLFRSQWTSLGSGGQLGPTPFEGDGYIPGSWKSQHGTISYLWKRKQVLKSKQNHAFLNSTPTFYYLTGRVCIWVSISLAYNASCDRSHFWSIRSQIPACCRAGLLSDRNVSLLCWFSCHLTLWM